MEPAKGRRGTRELQRSTGPARMGVAVLSGAVQPQQLVLAVNRGSNAATSLQRLFTLEDPGRSKHADLEPENSDPSQTANAASPENSLDGRWLAFGRWLLTDPDPRSIKLTAVLRRGPQGSVLVVPDKIPRDGGYSRCGRRPHSNCLRESGRNLSGEEWLALFPEVSQPLSRLSRAPESRAWSPRRIRCSCHWLGATVERCYRTSDLRTQAPGPRWHYSCAVHT